jgi:dinuclear metal center YbgI/SA1388 family protein
VSRSKGGTLFFTMAQVRMKLAEIEQFFESWAPRWTAWERDNVGLQVGRRSQSIKSVLVALDVTPEVVGEAIRKKIDLIVSHHPLLFRPPSSISDSTPVGALVLSLAEKRIALFSAHTNLDAAENGVSFALAKILGLTKTRFLAPLKDTMVKLAVFVPAEYVDRVSSVMAEAGAGIIGEYQSCSFQIHGKGTYRGSSRSQPFLGKPLQLEEVEEVRLEMVAPRALVDDVVSAMKAVHPYEEVAYDVYTVENSSTKFGMGAVGELPEPISLKAFLGRLKRKLQAESVRYTGGLNQKIKRVAVCGGSGADLMEQAIQADADVFVTADVRYHPFHTSVKRIALVDAGHWETEHVVVPVIADRLRLWAQSKNQDLDVSMTKYSTNPIHSY